MRTEAAIIEREHDLWRLSLWFKDEPTARLVLALIKAELSEAGFSTPPNAARPQETRE